METPIVSTKYDRFQRDLLQKLEIFLREQEEASVSEEPKLYFSGEENLSYEEQSEFERLSNYLEVGVIAHNETVALVLLHLIRVIIDQDFDLIYRDLNFLEEENGESYIDIQKILDLFSAWEKEYSLNFSSTEKLALEVRVGKKRKMIDRKLEDIDVWTLPRVMDTVNSMYCY